MCFVTFDKGQALATEMYKLSNNMSPTILNHVFAPRATPALPSKFRNAKIPSVCNGTEYMSHLLPKIWRLILHEVNQHVSLRGFKSKN